ncbi:CXXX repeat peptide modification system protein [Bacteroides fragilis]
MKKVVGQVSELEKREIQILFERRNGLNELAKILTADNTELYERLIKDLGETSIKFQKWWNQMSENINGKALMVETGRLILTHVKFIL